MAKTPLSSATSYCTGAQFLMFYDPTAVAMLLSDDGTPVADPENDPTLAEFLQSASGKVEAACLVGGKYAPEDLAALTGNMAGFLAQLVADLAWGPLYRRRPNFTPAEIPSEKEANQLLNALGAGTKIFGFVETVDAGVLELDEETTADVEERNMVTFQAQRYFGRRANRRGV